MYAQAMMGMVADAPEDGVKDATIVGVYCDNGHTIVILYSAEHKALRDLWMGRLKNVRSPIGFIAT